MATWPEIQTFIRRNYACRELDNGAIALTFTDGDAGRSQQVFVEPNNDEATWVTVKGFVAEWSPENAVKAIEENNQIFGIDRFLDWVVVTHAQLTATADEEEIRRALSGVALAADALELAVTGKDEF